MNTANPMQWIRANERLYVASTSGHSLSMARGEEKQVRQELAILAYARGAVAIDEPGGEPNESEPGPTSEVVTAAVREACLVLQAEGDPELFTANGRPKVLAVEALVKDVENEFITPGVVEEVWSDIQAG